MPATPQPTYLAYRVLNQNTGAEVIHDLPHLHQSVWTVNALQKGTAGMSGVGTFTIPLPAPRSDLYETNRSIFDSLAYGQKIEGYLGPTVAGNPRFTGVITNITKSLDSFVISGYDTLWWLQQSQMIPGELLQNVASTSDQVISQVKTGLEAAFDETCVSGNLTNYTQTPAAQFTSSTDPLTGAAAFKASGTNTGAVIVNNTSMASTFYQQARIDAIFYVQCGTTNLDHTNIELLTVSDATGANCVSGFVSLKNVAGTYTVDSNIFSVAASAYTAQATLANVFTLLPSAALRVQITLASYYQGTTAYWRLFVNGVDCGEYKTAANTSSGRVGFRYVATVTTGTAAVYIERLSWRFRNVASPRFAAGTVSTGVVQWNGSTHYNGQTALDLITQAQGTEGWYVRKNPLVGYKADSLDFGASPGTDLSGSVKFEEGINLVAAEQSANAELYALDLRMAGTAGANSGGSVVYPAVLNQNDLALIDTVLDTGVTDFFALYSYAQSVQTNKAAGGTAKTATVLRDPDTIDRWRELDQVTLHSPSLGLYNQKVTVLAYTFREGQESMDVVFDQYPDTYYQLPMARVQAGLEMIANLYKTR